MAKTGPKTAAGKLTVSKNAFKHGIASDVIVVEGYEDTEEWEGFRDGIIDSFNPANTMEHSLCERIAIPLWKLRRYEAYQRRMITAHVAGVAVKLHEDIQAIDEMIAAGQLSEDHRKEYDEDYVEYAGGFKLIPDRQEMELIMRYEAHYHRQYIQTLHELEAMQTRRLGGVSPLARFDVTGSPGG